MLKLLSSFLYIGNICLLRGESVLVIDRKAQFLKKQGLLVKNPGPLVLLEQQLPYILYNISNKVRVSIKNAGSEIRNLRIASIIWTSYIT